MKSKEYNISSDLKLVLTINDENQCIGIWLNDIILDIYEAEKLRILIDNRNNIDYIK